MLYIDHPNLVRTVSVEALTDGGSLITMEDTGGVTLAKFVETHGALSAEDCAYIGKKLCSAVEYLHSLTPPMLYCDMKPENIMVTGTPGMIEEVVLIDIDGSTPMALDGLPPEKSYGTKGYAAPEQLSPDAPLDFRVDVYGICATMDAVYKRRFLKGAADRSLIRIIKKGTRANIRDRYFTVRELSKDLRKI